ncbi:ParB-like protein [Caulobacter sp. KR2-114]|uniref:ParB-like protein n=1 Tax=Caulobacter sp. KR2-114 TaxID=3400912 RepID=UPI003C0215D4
MRNIEPVMHPLPIAALRPTQMTVGLGEVAEKRRAWGRRAAEQDADYLGRHTLPTVIGPKGRHYVIDHHHLARALHDEGQRHVLVSVQADLSGLSKRAFWAVMDSRGWSHPYDAEGRLRPVDDLPKSVARLADDPYRSLAGALRRAGGYAKVAVPFAEFLWADFLRERIALKRLKADPGGALKRALVLAESLDASYLPGWSGPDPG